MAHAEASSCDVDKTVNLLVTTRVAKCSLTELQNYALLYEIMKKGGSTSHVLTGLLQVLEAPVKYFSLLWLIEPFL